MKSSRRKTQTAKGYALLFALGLIAVMVVAIGGLMMRTANQNLVAKGVLADQIAMERAESAAETVISQIRSGTAGALTGFAQCGGPSSCDASNMVHLAVDAGSSLPLDQKGGRQYEYWLYRSVSGVGGVGGTFTIVADGFYGFANSTNLATAEVVVEIDAAQASLSEKFACSDYDCGH
jgi:Tfp pilus assembly protein PilX